jgi:hypothetical protein
MIPALPTRLTDRPGRPLLGLEIHFLVTTCKKNPQKGTHTIFLLFEGYSLLDSTTPILVCMFLEVTQ